MTGIEYIQLKREQIRKSSAAWNLGTAGLGEDDEKVLKKTLNFLDADENLINELIHAKRNDVETLHPTEEFRRILETYSDSLKDDLNVYTNDKYKELIQVSGLSILESGDIHAGCVRVDDYGDLLYGYAIFINVGTYYALQLLAKTIIIENFQNDFAKYRRKAIEFIDIATDIYISQDSRSTRLSYFDEYPSEIRAEAAAAQSSVVVKVMQFITLHELGHIVNGDLEIMGFHRRFMNTNHNHQADLPNDIELQQSHDAEFAADMFAFNALFDYDATPIQKWSGFYPIFYFLVWLDAIERKFGKVISNLHPNARERARRMQKALFALTDQDDLGYGQELENVITYFTEWSKSMSEEFTIHTKNPSLLTNIYDKKPTLNDTRNIDDVMNVRFISEAEIGKGFGGVEMAVTVAVSLVTGVASGVIANMIYDKIMEKGKNKIVIKEKRVTITTKEELIEYVEKYYSEQ